jgi:uncharacterized protein YciI
MIYAVTIEYGPDKAKIEEFRPPHREYLRELITKDILALAGPFVDNSGGFIVYNAESEEEVEAIIKADPFYACGVFQKWTIRQWKIVLANRQLLP